MSNSEEISDSIVVISSLSDEFNEDNESIRVINENSSIESSNSVMAINEGNECFKLEVEIGKLKLQIDELKNENHVLKQNLDVSRRQSNSSQDEKKSCLNCDLVVKKYDESVKESDKLLSKLKEYEKELDECKSNAKETASICESAFRELIAGLEELIRQCEEGKIQKGKEGQRNIQIEAFQLLSNNLIKTYKSLKINEFGSKYEATLKGLIESLSGKMMINNNKPKTSTKSSQTTTESSSTTGELIGQVINEGLNEFRQTTETCKEKLSQQKRMIQSLLNKINSSSNLPSLQQTDNSEQIEPAEHLGSTKETVQIQQPAETKKMAEIVSSIWLYHCPSCDVSIDPNQVSWEKFLLHKYTCGKSAVICTAML